MKKYIFPAIVATVVLLAACTKEKTEEAKANHFGTYDYTCVINDNYTTTGMLTVDSVDAETLLITVLRDSIITYSCRLDNSDAFSIVDAEGIYNGHLSGEGNFVGTDSLHFVYRCFSPGMSSKYEYSCIKQNK